MPVPKIFGRFSRTSLGMKALSYKYIDDVSLLSGRLTLKLWLKDTFDSDLRKHFLSGGLNTSDTTFFSPSRWLDKNFKVLLSLAISRSQDLLELITKQLAMQSHISVDIVYTAEKKPTDGNESTAGQVSSKEIISGKTTMYVFLGAVYDKYYDTKDSLPLSGIEELDSFAAILRERQANDDALIDTFGSMVGLFKEKTESAQMEIVKTTVHEFTHLLHFFSNDKIWKIRDNDSTLLRGLRKPGSVDLFPAISYSPQEGISEYRKSVWRRIVSIRSAAERIRYHVPVEGVAVFVENAAEDNGGKLLGVKYAGVLQCGLDNATKCSKIAEEIFRCIDTMDNLLADQRLIILDEKTNMKIIAFLNKSFERIISLLKGKESMDVGMYYISLAVCLLLVKEGKISVTRIAQMSCSECYRNYVSTCRKASLIPIISNDKNDKDAVFNIGAFISGLDERLRKVGVVANPNTLARLKDYELNQQILRVLSTPPPIKSGSEILSEVTRSVPGMTAKRFTTLLFGLVLREQIHAPRMRWLNERIKEGLMSEAELLNEKYAPGKKPRNN